MSLKEIYEVLCAIRDGIGKLVAFTVRGQSTRYCEEFGFNPAAAAAVPFIIQKRTRRKFLVRNIIVSLSGAGVTGGSLMFGGNQTLGGGDSRQFDVGTGLTSIPCSIMLTADDDRMFFPAGGAAKVSVILSGEEILEGAGSPPPTPLGTTFGATESERHRR